MYYAAAAVVHYEMYNMIHTVAAVSNLQYKIFNVTSPSPPPVAR